MEWACSLTAPLAAAGSIRVFPSPVVFWSPPICRVNPARELREPRLRESCWARDVSASQTVVALSEWASRLPTREWKRHGRRRADGQRVSGH